MIHDRPLYFRTVREVQNLIMARADLMLFHTDGGKAGWTVAARDRWQAAGKPCFVIG
ncbi:hypothetical protein [Thioclava sp. JE_KL1]|uniref:hypothetical protein n=1 Tax=Thioclava sp. JE_KL1 TaxID=2651187 RepID=UPI001561D993|nr:hypothetical protein [Thioclava sp. JE_KL1]